MVRLRSSFYLFAESRSGPSKRTNVRGMPLKRKP
jgi:hypothetical protein